MLDILVRAVDRLPPEGRTEEIESVGFASGGCALNTALAAARLGVRTSMAGRVGDDIPGRAILELLQSEPLDLSHLKAVRGEETSVCVVLLDGSGRSRFLVASRAGEAIEEEDVGELEPHGVVHVGAALQLRRLDLRRVFERAKAAGAVTTADVENGPSLDRPELLARFLPFVDWFMPSEKEAFRITGFSTARRAAVALLELGARGVVIKRAERGCLVQTSEETVAVSAPRVKVVDATGAGDCFVAGFVCGLIWGLEVPEAARFACACGARAVTEVGATRAITGPAAVFDLLPSELVAKVKEKIPGHDAGN